MLILAIFLGLALSDIIEVPAKKIKDFVNGSEPFKVLYFCDFNFDPCDFFRKTTRSQFSKIKGIVGEVNISTEEDAEIASEYGLIDFPYIVYFNQEATHTQYQGSLEPAEIYNTLNRIQRGIMKIEKLNELHEFVDNEVYTDGLILGISQKNFEDLEDLLVFMPVATTESREIREFFGCHKCVVVFKPGILNPKDPKAYKILKGTPEQHEITDAFYSGINFLTPNNHIWMKKDIPLVMLYTKFSQKEDPQIAKYIIKKYLEAVDPFMNDFTISLGKMQDFEWILEEIGIGGHKSLILIDDTVSIYMESDLLSPSGSLLTDKISNFLQGYKDKTLKPHIISEPEPEEPYENNLRVLVGSTITGYIQTLQKDTVLLVDSLSNEEYQVTLYMFEAIAKKITEIEFARIEANKNLVPSPFALYGYPAAFYIKPGYKPQQIVINLNEPKKTIAEIQGFYRSSQDL